MDPLPLIPLTPGPVAAPRPVQHALAEFFGAFEAAALPLEAYVEWLIDRTERSQA